ncbi:MAG TPA: 2-dehydropantoate 2-reductase N-terminal domain-containing protein [Acidimicrobiia bacterium]
MRYVMFGAGAIGGAIGGRLHEHGHDVVLVARGPHYEALAGRGLELRSPGGTAVLAVPVATDVRALELGPDDVVILTTKSQDTVAALDALGAAAPDVPVVCAQNGVANERAALRRFASVYSLCVMLPAVYLEPGVVAAHGAPRTGILDLGRYPGGVDATAERIAADLDGSGFSSRAVESPMRVKYQKLLMNLANAFQAVCGNDPAWGDLYTRARAEALACYEAAGIDCASDEEDRARREGVMRAQPVDGKPHAGGSSWQSLARAAGSIETDYLNGEIVLLGRLHGVPTPVNATIQRVANQAARERRPPGSVPVDELLPEFGIENVP